MCFDSGCHFLLQSGCLPDPKHCAADHCFAVIQTLGRGKQNVERRKLFVFPALTQSISGHVSRRFTLTEKIVDEPQHLVRYLGTHTDVDQARSEREIRVKILVSQRWRSGSPFLRPFVDSVWERASSPSSPEGFAHASHRARMDLRS